MTRASLVMTIIRILKIIYLAFRFLGLLFMLLMYMMDGSAQNGVEYKYAFFSRLIGFFVCSLAVIDIVKPLKYLTPLFLALLILDSILFTWLAQAFPYAEESFILFFKGFALLSFVVTVLIVIEFFFKKHEMRKPI
jgi:hypothetical protein